MSSLKHINNLNFTRILEGEDLFALWRSKCNDRVNSFYLYFSCFAKSVAYLRE